MIPPLAAPLIVGSGLRAPEVVLNGNYSATLISTTYNQTGFTVADPSPNKHLLAVTLAFDKGRSALVTVDDVAGPVTVQPSVGDDIVMTRLIDTGIAAPADAVNDRPRSWLSIGIAAIPNVSAYDLQVLNPIGAVPSGAPADGIITMHYLIEPNTLSMTPTLTEKASVLGVQAGPVLSGINKRRLTFVVHSYCDRTGFPPTFESFTPGLPIPDEVFLANISSPYGGSGRLAVQTLINESGIFSPQAISQASGSQRFKSIAAVGLG